MNTDHPTVTLYFVFAFTYCRLLVYEKQEAFARKMLEAAGVEFSTPNGRDCRQDYQEVDTRLLLALVATAFPKMLKKALPTRDEIIKQTSELFEITPS